MLVVADTSPLNYLIQIGAVDVLPEVYDRLIVPTVVLSELTAEGSPHGVAAWASNPPAWLIEEGPPLGFVSNLTSSLDPGEQAAIHIALHRPGSLLLIDEASGRAAANQLGIANTGTLGVLLLASERGLIELEATLERLARTNFRVSKKVLDAVLRRHQDFRRKSS